MGIRHLFTFICNNVPSGLFPVNMSDKVEEFKIEHPGERPLIIVDIFALHQKAYTNKHEILLGGRYNIYNERINQMLIALESLDARIVYFCNGPHPPNKIDHYLRRRNDNYAHHVKLLHAIDDGLDLSGPLDDYEVQNLTPLLQNIIELANRNGEIHMSTLNKCNQEIAEMASKEGALAIVTQDTDFLIFKGKWKYWLADALDFETLDIWEFNKTALRRHLSLSSRQMILLGTLSGNDILEYSLVKDYHQRIAPRGGKFYKIANEVRKFRSLPPVLRPSEEDYIVNTVFNPEDRCIGRTRLRQSLNMYCYIGMELKHKNNILEKISKDPKRLFYVILNNQEFIINLLYFDLSKDFFMPYYNLIQQILRRIMGILLHDQQHLQPERVFLAKLVHERPYEKIIETPDYPLYKRLPPILELLYHPYGRNQELDHLRLDLFCWQISPNLNSRIVLQLPKENLLNVVTILYLIEKNQISVEEGDCILLACNCPPDIRDSLSYDEVKQIDGRDARLTFLFARMFNWFHDCLDVVGLGIFIYCLEFDGLYFHWLRKQCKQDKNFLQVLLEKYQNLRIYDKQNP